MARWVVRHYSPAHLSLPLVCVQLKDDAVALADVLAPPDAILQSAIGRESGEVRQHRWPVKWLCLCLIPSMPQSHSVFNLVLLYSVIYSKVVYPSCVLCLCILLYIMIAKVWIEAVA